MKKNKNSTPKTHQVEAVGPGWEDDFSIGWILFWGTLHFENVSMNQFQVFQAEKIAGYGASPTNHQFPEFLFEVNNFRNLLWSCPIGHINVLVFGWKK